MSIRVHIPAPLRQHTDNQGVVEAQGPTVQDLLEDLDRRYPGLRQRLLEDGHLRRFLHLYVNDEDIRDLEELGTPLRQGDELSILVSISGG